MLERIKEKEQKIIHPDFQLDFLRFSQNFEWNGEKMGGNPEVKITFIFNDPALLDGCPFVCKISKDAKGNHRFFGVAYGRKKDADALRKWAERFDESKLFTYQGEFLEKPNKQVS